MANNTRNFNNPITFGNATKITLAAVLPILVCYLLGEKEAGFSIAIGALLTYPGDIPSAFPNKIRGILMAVFSIVISTIAVHLTYPHTPLLIITCAVIWFTLSLFAVYGLRAIQISFSGLLAVCLALGHIQEGIGLWTHALFLGIGGLFYLLISVLAYKLRPHRFVEWQLAENLFLTAKYLKLRGRLWDPLEDRDKIMEKQLKVQVELNTLHEHLRELMLNARQQSGLSDRLQERVLVLIYSIEILELGLATTFDHRAYFELFKERPKYLKAYQELAFELATTLKKIATAVFHNQSYKSTHKLGNKLERYLVSLQELEDELGANSEPVLVLQNMLYYVEQQYSKIRMVEKKYTGETMDMEYLKSRGRDMHQFVNPTNYSWEKMWDNLNWNSSTFRHAVRFTLTMLSVFPIAHWLELTNYYWIMLTIVVIMRPGYGLTKSKSYDRIVGTILGGVFAFLFLHFFGSGTLLIPAIVLFLFLGFAYTPTHYSLGVFFVTVYVVMIYGLLFPNENIAAVRILDTAIGGALAYIATVLLFPSWEFTAISSYLRKSIQSNTAYLEEIVHFYHTKGEPSLAYRLARKNAFIDLGNLMASYQRMQQEPKSKQKHAGSWYKIVVVNQVFMQALAALGTYIQDNTTTQPSAVFDEIMQQTKANLSATIEQLEHKKPATEMLDPTAVTLSLAQLKKQRFHELESSDLPAKELKLRMRESQLVLEQLLMLYRMSARLRNYCDRLLLEQA